MKIRNALRLGAAVITIAAVRSAFGQIEISIPAQSVDSYRADDQATISAIVVNHGASRTGVVTLNVYDSGYPSDLRLIYDSHQPGAGETADQTLEFPAGSTTPINFRFWVDQLPRPGIYRVLGVVQDPSGQVLDTTGPGIGAPDWSIAAHIPSFTVEPDLSNGTKGITILLHGYVFGGQSDITRGYWDDCRVEICSLLRAYGGGVVREYNATTGTFETVSGYSCNPPVDSSGEVVLVHDWALVSNQERSGEAEAAADAFLAALVSDGYVDPRSPAEHLPIHIIAHSRGAAVASELVQRLGCFGVSVDYVTYLDPHDWDEPSLYGDENYIDPAVQVWTNVQYADNIYQETDWPLVPSGRPLGQLQDYSPFTVNLTGRLDNGCGWNSHTRITHWYFGTVEPRQYPGADVNTWYPGDVFNGRGGYSSGFSRWVYAGGYDGAGASNGILNAACPTIPSNCVPVPFPSNDTLDDNLANPMFFNGTFDLPDLIDSRSPDAVAGWHYHGGGGTGRINLESDGNHYLELRRNSGEDRRTRTHNRFYLSQRGIRFTFRFRNFYVPVPGAYTLRLVLDDGAASVELWSLPISAVTDWITVAAGAEVPEDWRGRVYTLEFVLTGQSTASVRVGIDDIRLLSAGRCEGDLNWDGSVGLADLALLLSNFGTPVGATFELGDLSDDGAIELADLAVLLSRFGTSCSTNAPPPATALIPAGEFQMGNSFSGEGYTEERPRHAVYVDAFYMDLYEVTNAQYAAALNWARAQGNLITVTNGVVFKFNSGFQYCDTTTSSSYSRITWNGSTFGVVPGKEQHPMVQVSWHGAAAYCNWRSAMAGKPLCYNLSTWTCNFDVAGFRLPTEAEWERAARGGAAGRRFPWSDQDTIQHARCNYYSSTSYFYDNSATRSYHPLWGTGSRPWTSPVGFFDGSVRYRAEWGWPGSATSYQTANGANGYGLHDMAGNVWEWCNDWYQSNYYSSNPPYNNPTGPASGTSRVLRGGMWDNIANVSRVAYRVSVAPDFRYYNGGFRCTSGTP